MSVNLSLYQRLARGTAFYGNITRHAPDWKRTIAAIGGYKVGSFTAQNLSRADIQDWYDRYLGCRIVETTYGITSWEGIVYEMRLILDGVEYCRTLAPEWCHNNVQVVYTDTVGARQVLAWSENVDSSDEYGEIRYQVSIGSATAAAAIQLQTRHLKEFAWPRSRMVGAVALDNKGKARKDSLTVSCVGYWATMNWRFRETNLTAYDAGSQITFLWTASEFILGWRIEANTLSVHVTISNPQGLGELMADVIEQGDASGNVWKGGVYADRHLIYEQAPTAVSHYLRDGVLVDLSGTPVIPSLVEPGFLLYNSAAPTGLQPVGTSSPWDNPQVVYVEEVEFVAPDKLNLKLYGVEESVALLEMKMRRGTP